ncbi:MAG: hypothetical protein KKF77_03505 [Proteobacteria bacterium]|nr:hypothetical protein [Pseudomonadota bacterium]
MLYCPKCSAPGPFTQEGLSPLLIRLGFYICVSCLGLVRPVNGAPAASVAQTEAQAETPQE